MAGTHSGQAGETSYASLALNVCKAKLISTFLFTGQCYICDMIKGNESLVGTIQFEVFNTGWFNKNLTHFEN